jgi:hypothetical protein
VESKSRRNYRGFHQSTSRGVADSGRGVHQVSYSRIGRGNIDLTKLEGLEKRLDQLTPKQEEAYRRGVLDGERAGLNLLGHLPFIFQQTINEYLHSPEKYVSGPSSQFPRTKQEALDWFKPVIEKQTEFHAKLDSFYGKDSTMYKCPNCPAEYFSGLLMAFHMFDRHAVETRKQ